MDVVLLGPGYPSEMPLFALGLAAVGARVIGVGDQHVDQLPEPARRALSDYIRVDSWADEAGAYHRVLSSLRGRNVELVETLWEPTVVLAARLREAIGAPGLTVERAVQFRDKGRMKEVVAAAGLRVPVARRTTTRRGCLAAAEEIGYPVIVKPIAGAGSLDTYRVGDATAMNGAVDRLGHVGEVSVEEFIDGEEFTYDTVCAGGRIVFDNICEYRPRPLIGKQNEWISQQVISHRDLDSPLLAGGRQLGRDVIAAFGLQSGITHMEWYRKPDGEVVFGEIGARAPGARLTDLMNYSCDVDMFTGWAEAVCHGRLSQHVEHKYNAAMVIKRAEGSGRITHVEGLAPLLAAFGEHVVNVDLLAPGEPRRDWRQTVLSDGIVVVRHPDLATTYEMADRVGVELRLYAGG